MGNAVGKKAKRRKEYQNTESEKYNLSTGLEYTKENDADGDTNNDYITENATLNTDDTGTENGYNDAKVIENYNKDATVNENYNKDVSDHDKHRIGDAGEDNFITEGDGTVYDHYTTDATANDNYTTDATVNDYTTEAIINDQYKTVVINNENYTTDATKYENKNDVDYYYTVDAATNCDNFTTDESVEQVKIPKYYRKKSVTLPVSSVKKAHKSVHYNSDKMNLRLEPVMHAIKQCERNINELRKSTGFPRYKMDKKLNLYTDSSSYSTNIVQTCSMSDFLKNSGYDRKDKKVRRRERKVNSELDAHYGRSRNKSESEKVWRGCSVFERSEVETDSSCPCHFRPPYKNYKYAGQKSGQCTCRVKPNFR